MDANFVWQRLWQRRLAFYLGQVPDYDLDSVGVVASSDESHCPGAQHPYLGRGTGATHN